ncbi:sulfurtransferase TusA family protein [Nocardioides jejuensis]|uniref:Sulfurtransferase TusA family protein n=1 Tax=Nocardioides jejuensis TaxID=2502782 RepID=A0A4R1BVS9_9ACTN|nr:sulfurtransferase TusA family protein [Nocardioides jejuensis]TCJ21446.1 sulfurtransferase TusA family protein [Nocardioides jejuensis]
MRLDLDCRGLRCPAPIIALAKALPTVDVGDEIAVAATDVAARVDVQAWCRMRDQEYVGEEMAEDGTPLYVVRRLL